MNGLDLKGIANKIIGSSPQTQEKPENKQSTTDPAKGREDNVPGMIDGKEPVGLSEGEFIIPADVVAALGQGNPDAGSQILASMVKQIRERGANSGGATKSSIANV
jgi:hypothetical protein